MSDHPREPLLRLVLAIALIVGGLGLAEWVQTRGNVSVQRVAFRAADGTILAGLVYHPATATAARRAPGVLAVHGYINTRETQSAFAIEFARRGYVVLALDQRGHGDSGGAATKDGFGGLEGLAYLRSLPFVDRDRIGLEGHSMGGWTVLAAAAAMPNAYRAIVLEGSSTGAPFAREGTPDWPRNLAVVYSRYDEFAPLMWGVPRAADVGSGDKLKTLFGTTAPVVPDRVYGSVAGGTARLLRQPVATHPGDHLSRAAVADAIDWFGHTLGTPRAGLLPTDQIWWLKEAGTGLALIGLAVLTFALFDLMLGVPLLAALRTDPPVAATTHRGAAWWTLLLTTSLIPAITFYLAPLALPPPIGPSRLLPQAVTDWLTMWAVANALIGLVIGWKLRRSLPSRPLGRWFQSALLAGVVVSVLYVVVAAAAAVPLDFRFWVVAVRPLAFRLVFAWLAYLLPFAGFLLIAFRGLDALLAPLRTLAARRLVAVAASAGGFLMLTGGQYLFLFAAGRLPIAFEALNTIVAIQFVPLLAGLALLAVHSRERTRSILPGALIGGLFVTWYMVAGTATHVPL